MHHIRYRNLFDVELCDLAVLCQACHTEVHRVLREYPRGNKPEWGSVRSIVIERLLRKSAARAKQKSNDCIYEDIVMRSVFDSAF